MISIPENMVGQLEKELRAGWERNKIEAKAAAQSNARFNAERHRSVEGLGQKIATIPATAYHFGDKSLDTDAGMIRHSWMSSCVTIQSAE